MTNEEFINGRGTAKPVGLAQQPREWKVNSVHIPVERFGVFQTFDREVYHRDDKTGVIRHTTTKVRGKAARRADKLARREK